MYRPPTLVSRSAVRAWMPLNRQFNIEYGRGDGEPGMHYFSNHLTHVFVVLAGMGADERDARYQTWLDSYRHKLEPAAAAIQDSSEEGTADMTVAPPPFQSMATYPSRLRFYDAEVQQRGMEGAVHAHLPRLMPGVSGAALHPLIHTGWAADVGSDTMLAEGLAYLDAAGTMLGTPEHPGAPPNWAASPEGLPILEASLAFVTRARELGLPQQTADTAATPEYKRRGRGGFQHKVMTFADPALPHAAVLEACGPLQLPALEAPLTSAIVEATALAAAGLYASNNEFFVLHTLTSLHGVLALQPALSPQNRRELLAQWWRAAMAALVALQLPAADTLAVDLQQWQQERGEERRMQEAGQPEALAQQRQADDAARRVDNLTSCDEEAQLWRAALDRALTSEDEHVPKAVYTLWRWSCFEGMPPSSRRLFRRAAMNQVRPVDGNLAESLWFSAPGHSEPPRKRL